MSLDDKRPAFVSTAGGDFATLPEAKLELLMKQRAVLEEFLSLRKQGLEAAAAYAERLDVSPATFYRLLKRYRNNRTLPGLVGPTAGRRPGMKLLDQEVEGVIAWVIQTHYLTPQRLNNKEIYNRVMGACTERGLPVPAMNTVRARLNALPKMETLVAREGAKAAREQRGRVRGHVPVGEYPLDLYQIDHSPGDVIIVDEKTRQEVGRPWLTLVIDTFSRAIAGFYLSLDSGPSAVQAGLGLYHAVMPKESYLRELGIGGTWPIHGRPMRVFSDNGSDLTSKAFVGGCRANGIDPFFRPKGRPEAGGHIERAIGKVASFAKTLPGATWSNPLQRGDYDSSKRAVLTLRELEAIIAVYCCYMHNKMPHAVTFRPPEAMFLEGVAGYPDGIGQRNLRLPDDPSRFYLDFLPYGMRRLQRTGIDINGFKYSSEALTPLIAEHKSEEMLVRYDPRDISHIYLQLPDGSGYLRVPAMQLNLPSIDLHTARRLRQQTRQKGKAESDPRSFAHGLRLQEEIIQNATVETKAQRRSRARKTDGVAIHLQPGKVRPPAVTRPDTAPRGAPVQNKQVAQKIDVTNLEPFEDVAIWRLRPTSR